MKKNIIRIGDNVKIIVPKFFLRCGYPMCPEIETHSIQKEFGKELNDILLRIGVKNSFSLSETPIITKVCKEIAYAKCKTNGYGGKQRQIFTEEMPKLKDSILSVIDTKYVRTGKYIPASKYSTYDSMTEYDPAELIQIKTHKILRLRCPSIASKAIWIEAANVEKCL